MSDISWLDVVKILIPIIAVILAGFFALYRMRSNIKLEAKYKWKEEFRSITAEYIQTVFTLQILGVKQRIDSKSEQYPNIDYEIIEKNEKLMWLIYKILFLVNRKHKNYDKIEEVLEKQQKYLTKILNKEKVDINKDGAFDEYFDLTKSIYDNYI